MPGCKSLLAVASVRAGTVCLLRAHFVAQSTSLSSTPASWLAFLNTMQEGESSANLRVNTMQQTIRNPKCQDFLVLSPFDLKILKKFGRVCYEICSKLKKIPLPTMITTKIELNSFNKRNPFQSPSKDANRVEVVIPLDRISIPTMAESILKIEKYSGCNITVADFSKPDRSKLAISGAFGDINAAISGIRLVFPKQNSMLRELRAFSADKQIPGNSTVTPTFTPRRIFDFAGRETPTRLRRKSFATPNQRRQARMLTISESSQEFIESQINHIRHSRRATCTSRDFMEPKVDAHAA